MNCTVQSLAEDNATQKVAKCNLGSDNFTKVAGVFSAEERLFKSNTYTKKKKKKILEILKQVRMTATLGKLTTKGL